MGQLQLKTFETILTRMVNRVVARTDLNDLNDGSSVKQVLGAAAREDDDQYFQMGNLLDLFDIMKARGTDLDERAKEYNPAIITRNPATTSTGQVVFSRTGTSGTITIPIGTQVQVPAAGSNPAVVFQTTEVGTILAGATTSGLVDVKAVKAGISGRAAVGTVIGFVTKPSGVNAVTNPAAFTTGDDVEKDDSFRRRLLAYAKGLARAHVYGLETAVMNLTDSVTAKTVRFANVVEDPVDRGNVILYIDDGAGTLGADYATVAAETLIAAALGGEVDFYATNKPMRTDLGCHVELTRGGVTFPLTEGVDYSLNPVASHIKILASSAYYPIQAGDMLRLNGGPGYAYWTGLIQLAQKVIDGDPLDRKNYPGYRAGGVLVQVLSPQVVNLTITANITVRQGYQQTDVAAAVKAAISSHINSLGISEDVILAELDKRAMSVPGMYDIKWVEPTANRVILDDQIARVLSSNITVS